MAGRAATAVKPKSKVRSGAKATSRVKAPKVAAVAVDGATVEAPKPRKRVKVETRTRIYWAVFNQHLKRIAVFEFDQKEEAEKRSEKLTKASGDQHFIQKIKATVQV
jgi:hypothetical protein